MRDPGPHKLWAKTLKWLVCTVGGVLLAGAGIASGPNDDIQIESNLFGEIKARATGPAVMSIDVV